MTLIKTIQDSQKAGHLVIGTKRVIREVREGKIKEIVYAENCPQETLSQITHYAKTDTVSVNKFEGSSARLGEVCGKPFRILLLGIENKG